MAAPATLKTAARFAAPSFVMPGTVAENARFLSGRAAEVGLCLFETRACLEYGAEDLPPDLAALPLTWHVHLPVDLPWEDGGAAAASSALTVLEKVRYLAPHVAVLHPPETHGDPARRDALLVSFAAAWRGSGISVLLENIDGCPLTDMVDVICGQDFGVCLDVGHLLGYDQNRLPKTPELMERVRLVHWSAPGVRDQHLPLTALTPEQRTAARRVAAGLPDGVTHLVEVFHWRGVEESLPVLDSVLGMSGRA